MATKYIEIQPVNGLTQEEAAKEFSKRIWNIQRPDSVKDPRDVTRYMFGIQPHPINENDWVVVADDSVSIRKHIEAVASEISSLGDNLSQAEKDGLESVITSNESIPMSDILTAFEKQIIQYPIWSDLPNGFSFTENSKVAIFEQTGEEDVLVFYEIAQPHNKQSDRSPENTPALWNKITVAGDYEIWSQPTGAHNAYAIGDRVLYPDANGLVYESKINANTTIPTGDAPFDRYWKVVEG